jgi:capsular exopolysaccharide synthesis family protein
MTVEAFLHLCVTLHLGNKRRMRSLSIVSARRGEGKSTIAYNLAKALALLSPRVLLVDGDLRQPTLHEKAKCSNAIGLKEVLDGSLPLGEGVVEIAPGLDLLTSRGDIDNPVVTLQCAFASLLDTAKARYEMVVVDAPALGAVSDGLVIATHVDGSLLVVAADAASSSDAKDAVARMKLAGIENVLGVVVNRDAPVINDYDDYFAKIAGAAAAAGTAT